MITTRRARPSCTPGLGRILAAALVLSALLATIPPPAQALPLSGNGPLAGLLSWFEGLLADLGFASEVTDGSGRSDGPEAAFLPEGCVGDPGGSPCSKGLTVPQSEVQDAEKTQPNRPVAK